MAIKSNKTKAQVYRETFALLTNGYIPDEIFNAFINDEDGECCLKMQEWCVNNMRGEIMDWCTGIGIIEAVKHLYQCAIENGNFKTETQW